MVKEEERVYDWAGLMLCAAFKDAASVFLDFRVPGMGRLMGPFRLIPGAEGWFRGSYRDKWLSEKRLGEIVRSVKGKAQVVGKRREGKGLKLTFVHALNDKVIPWKHCEDLFWSVVRECVEMGRGGDGMIESELENEEVSKRVERWELGEGGWFCRFVDGDIVVKQRVVKYGGKWLLVSVGVVR